MMQKQGTYVMSHHGVCSLDDKACRDLHFGDECRAEDLQHVGVAGINHRKHLVESQKPVMPSVGEIPLVPFGSVASGAQSGTEIIDRNDLNTSSCFF